MARKQNRIFTLDDANRMLPLVRPIVADILRAGNDMKEMSRQTMTGDHAAKLEQRIGQLKGYLQELEDLGCSYKDWDFKTGIVDFPGELDGEAVLYSWKSDEPAVHHYHFPSETMEMRKPVPSPVSND
jgi:hypothetical protein